MIRSKVATRRFSGSVCGAWCNWKLLRSLFMDSPGSSDKWPKEMVGGRINNNPSDASHSSGEEYFGIDEEGNAYALKCSTSNKLMASRGQEGCLGDESTTEDESEGEAIIKVASPQSAERPLHTSSLEKRAGRGRGKQVTSFQSHCNHSHQNRRRST